MKTTLWKRLPKATAIIIALSNFQFLAVAANSYLWNVASPAANAWNVAGNWTPNGVAGAADTNIFGNVGPSANSTTVNNEVTASVAISTLLFTNVNAGQWDVTEIPSTVTLTVATNFTVGFIAASNNAATSSVVVLGPGTLQVTGNMTIGNSGTSSLAQSTILDLSALTNFVYNDSAGTIAVSYGNRSAANFKLADGSNYITAATINDNTSSASSSGTGNMTLGAGTNIINVGTFNIAAQRGSSTVSFPAGNVGGLYVRGVAGTPSSQAAMVLGNRSAGATSGGTSTGTLNLNGNPVNMNLSTLTVGQSTAAGAAFTNSGFGFLQFDTGTISASTVDLAVQGTLKTNSASGTITVGANATLNIGSGGLSLVNEAVTSQMTCTGAVNVANGVVNSSGSILKTTLAGMGTISITNGTLNMTAGTVGTPAIPVDVLNLNGASLQLAVNGALSSTNIVATTINTAGTTTITINSVGGVTSPTTIPLISYTGTDPISALSPTVSVPMGYGASLVDNPADSRIDLSITPPPTLTWVGALSDATPDANWNTTDQNWLNGAVFSAYSDPDIVQFSDTASNTTVTLSGVLFPGSISVDNNSSNYVFTGTGALSGPAAIIKSGTASLTLSETGGDNFSGGFSISSGSVLLDNANSDISGGASISDTTSLQIGNDDTNGTLSGNIADNGLLVYDRVDTLTNAGAITGTGSVTQNGSDTLTLSGASSFSGGLTINAGAIRASGVGSPGTSLITVNNGGTFVAGAAHTNSITLNGGAVLGTSASAGLDMPSNQVLTIAGTVTNTIYSADPQAPTTSLQFLVDAALQGGGSVICMNALTNDTDNGQGVRFRNTNVISTFSGTVFVSNNTKGELSFGSPADASFSPIGGGQIVMLAGGYYGTNGMWSPFGTGYSELLLRNNGAGLVTAGNNLSLSGTGAAIVNAIGAYSVVMGQLTLGNDQELIGYKASGGVTNVVTFSSVSLTGGNATFSPHSVAVGATNQTGTDFSLGAVSEQTAGSSITLGGDGNLTLSGANTYTGDTIITNGVLSLTNTASLASPNIIIAAGATFNVSGLSSAFTLGSAQTLSNITSTAVLAGNAGTGSGTVSLNYLSPTPSLIVTNGTLTLDPSTTFYVWNNGPALTRGSYNLVSIATAGNAGSVAGTVPSSVTVAGNGIFTSVTPYLQITSGQLFLVVPDSPPVIANIVTNSVSSGANWQIAISALETAAGWSDADGDTLTLSSVGPTSNLGNSVTTDGTSIYYNAPVTAEDFFTYTITDGTLTATGTVYLEAIPLTPANGSVTYSAGTATLNFTGVAGSTNVTLASTNLLTGWVPISTNVADGSGDWQVIDTSAGNFPVRFYESYQLP